MIVLKICFGCPIVSPLFFNGVVSRNRQNPGIQCDVNGQLFIRYFLLNGRINIADDRGAKHDFVIPEVAHVPNTFGVQKQNTLPIAFHYPQNKVGVERRTFNKKTDPPLR